LKIRNLLKENACFAQTIDVMGNDEYTAENPHSALLFVPSNEPDCSKIPWFILLLGFFIGWSHKKIKFFTFLCRIK